MIKTVSFAPPRTVRAATSSNKTSVKGASRDSNSRVASSSAPAKVAPVKTQAAPSSAKKVEAVSATLDVTEARATLTPKKPRAAKLSPDVVADAVVVKVKPAKRGANTAEKVEEKTTDERVVATEKMAPKVKRSRAPKDLAAQYGGSSATEDVPRRVVEAVAPRKRLTRAKKEARSQLLRADDEVLQRLQQANAIEAKKPERRGRGWEFECGCCGRVTRFQTPGAICECGAIGVRE